MEKINISESTYRRFERNEIAPDLNVISKIAKIYDLSLSDLLSDEKIIFNTQQSDSAPNNIVIMNQFSEKVIEQFEFRIKEKDEFIDRLNKIIDKFA